MASNPLSASSLSPLIASSLPQNSKPQLKSPTEAIALACHAGMLSVGCRLIGLGEDDRIETPSTSSSVQPLPANWNAQSSISFRYAHAQSSMEYLLKVQRLGNKTVVYGIGMGDDKTTSFDVTTKDFISDAALPSTPSPSSATPTEDTLHAIQSLFISPSRLTDLGSLLRLNIIQKLIPALQKEGYEETPTSSASTQQQPPQDQPRNAPYPYRPEYDPLRDDPLLPPNAQPRRPYGAGPPLPSGEFPPPGFEDEYDLQRPPRGPPGAGGGLRMPGYGERDLYPAGLGPRDPLRPGGLGPGFAGGPPGGGMHPTFDDPMFGGGGGGGGGDYGMQAPPGARWDPVGPGAPRGGRGRGGFGGGPMGGGPGNPFGGFGSGDFI